MLFRSSKTRAKRNRKIAMRLNDSQIAAIRRVVAEQAGEEAQVRLFGSRLNDQAKGGDVDLLVQV